MFSRRRFFIVGGVIAAGLLAYITRGRMNSLLESELETESEPAPEPDIDKLFATRDDVIDGYIVRLDEQDKIIGPGWSVNPGDRIGIAINGSTIEPTVKNLTVTDIFGNELDSISDVLLQPQEPSNSEPWEQGSGYKIDATFKVPHDFSSGVYFISNIPELFFVVRKSSPNLTSSSVSEEKGKTSKRVTVLFPLNTINAYSRTRNYSFYGPEFTAKASFYRPMTSTKDRNWLPVLQWLHSEGPIDVNTEVDYLIDSDLEKENVLDSTDVLFVIGHSEYWSRKARDLFDEFISRGGRALVASGNTMWWQVRYEGVFNSLLVGFKSKLKLLDPMRGTPLETTSWSTGKILPTIKSTLGANFKHGGFGVSRKKKALGWDGFAIASQNSPLLEGTNLKNGDYFELFKVAEYDGCPILGFDSSGIPVPDLDEIDAHRFELVGFDLGYRSGHTVGTMHVIQKTTDSGTIVQIGAMPIARLLRRAAIFPEKFGGSGKVVRQVLFNSLEKLLHEKQLFSEKIPERTPKWAITTPFKETLPDDFFWLHNRPRLLGQPESASSTNQE